MKILLPTLLLLGGLNLILARSVHWDPYNSRPSLWSNFDNDYGLFGLSSIKNSGEMNEHKPFRNTFIGKSSEESEETVVPKTNDELDVEVFDNFRERDVKKLDSYFNLFDSIMDNNDNEGEVKFFEKSEASKNEEEDKTLKKENESSEGNEWLVLGKNSEDLNEIISLNNDNDDNVKDSSVMDTELEVNNSSEQKFGDSEVEISEKDIKELTDILLTLSNWNDLMKAEEKSSSEENILDDEELSKQKLKEVNQYLFFFGSILDKILDTTSKVNSDLKNTENIVNRDNDDENIKNNNNNNDDFTIKSKGDDTDGFTFEFYDIDENKQEQNLNNHKYDIIQKSTTSESEPTTTPYLLQVLSSNLDNNNIIKEYVGVSEEFDSLQKSLHINKLNLDKAFYNIIANESNDKNMKIFDDDILVLRDNIAKIKQSVDAIQDLKSKLYFHKIVKAAIRESQIN